MPSRLRPSTGRITSASVLRYPGRLPLFECPGCSQWRLLTPHKNLSSRVLRSFRTRHPRRQVPSSGTDDERVYSLATAINAAKELSLSTPASREVYDDLSDLKAKGSGYVNLSRLQL